MKHNSPKICIEKLCKSFGKLQVLKNLDLTIFDGETLVIMGRSGVGKSVLLKHIIGIEKPDSGTVILDGSPITSLTGADLYKALKKTGMLFQSAALFDSLTVGENTGFYLDQHGDPRTGKRLTRDEIKERVKESLEMVGLEGTELKMPSDLSGGMKKRAGLARLIAYRPDVLLYDEPTTGLDPITSNQINQLIIDTQKNLKATSIVVTHDVKSALMIADRLAFHHDKRIICVEEKEEFMTLKNPQVKEFMENAMNE